MTGLARWVTLLALATVPVACSGIDLSGGPGREVVRETGPLTVPPHMRDGAHQ